MFHMLLTYDLNPHLCLRPCARVCVCVWTQVRIVAGRPMHCQVPGIEYTMGKKAVQTMLEGATAIALSYNGVLYIAESDEKKIHRIRQVVLGNVE